MQLLEGVTVLVVEDDIDMRELMEVVLASYGAQVRAVDGAQAARRSLALQTPDVLVSDIGMPDEDGYSLIRSVRALDHAQRSRLPAIAVTAFGTVADRRRAVEAGFDTHLAKPVDPAVLAHLVLQLTTSHQQSMREHSRP